MHRTTENLIYALRATDPQRKARLAQARGRRERKLRLRDAGVCVQCGQELDRDGSRCTRCVDLSARLIQEHRADRKARGLCRQCGRPHPHQDHERERREKRKASGLCVRCGKRPPFRGRVACRECLQRSAASAQAARDRKAGGAQ